MAETNEQQNKRIVIPTMSSEDPDLVAEIDWNEHVKGKYIRLTIGKHRLVIKKEYLLMVLFMLGDEGDQDKLLSPFVKQTKVLKFFKLIGVIMTKDVRKGDTMNIPLEFTFNPENEVITIGKGNMGGLNRRRN